MRDVAPMAKGSRDQRVTFESKGSAIDSCGNILRSLSALLKSLVKAFYFKLLYIIIFVCPQNKGIYRHIKAFYKGF